MFKKFKDKLAEEMKQSPARLQASMHQIAQAVVSPALSNSSIQDISSKDNFSLIDESDETPKNSPLKFGFQNVDLTSPSANSLHSRRSSISSSTSDVSSLFPIYESSSSSFNFQSDMDHSGSEADDNINSQLDRVSKEQLYSAYRKFQGKYHKYKGRYSDLITHFQDVEKSKTKLESILVETQDKALRRISSLKEQCMLEQQAKAHLEESLRNDLEEKDHVINVLKTKISLLQEKGSQTGNLDSLETKLDNSKNSIDLLDNEINPTSNESDISSENVLLKEKIHHLDKLNEKYKEMLKRNKEKILEVTNDKNTLERDYELLQRSSKESLNNLESDLISERHANEIMRNELDNLRKREEDSAISLAENKVLIHRELEEKEELIKKLREDLQLAISNKDAMPKKKVRFATNQNQDVPNDTSDYINKISSELQKNFAKHEEEMNIKYDEVIKRKNELSLQLENFEIKAKELQRSLKEKIKLINELKEQNYALEMQNQEILRSSKISEDKLKEHDELVKVKILNYEKQLSELKQTLAEKIDICNKSNLKIEEYKVAFDKFKQKLMMQTEEINSLKSKPEDTKSFVNLKEDLDIKCTEILGLSSELKAKVETVNNLKRRINTLENINNKTVQEIRAFKSMSESLKKECLSFKLLLTNTFESTENDFLKILTSMFEENTILKSHINELTSHKENIEKLSKGTDEKCELLEKVQNENISLQKELKEQFNKIEELKVKINQTNDLEEINRKLFEEISIVKNLLDNEKQFSNKQQKLLEDAETKAQKSEEIVANLTAKYETEIKNLQIIQNEKEKIDLSNATMMESIQQDILKLKDTLLTKDKELQEMQLKLASDENHISQLSHECENYKTLIDQSDKKLKAYNKEINKNREQLNSIIQQVHCFIKSSNKDSQELQNLVISFVEMFNNEVAHLRSTIELIFNENKNFEEREAELLTINKQLEANINMLSENSAKLETAYYSFEEENKILKQALEDKEAVLKQEYSKTQELQKLLVELDDLKNKNHELNSILIETKTSYENESSKFDSKIQELENSKHQLDSELKSFKITLDEYKKAKENLEKELTSCRKENNELQQSISSKFNELQCLESESNSKISNLTKDLNEKLLCLRKCEEQNREFSEQINQLLALKSSADENENKEKEHLHLKISDLENLLKDNEETKSNLEKSLDKVNAYNKKLESDLDEILVTLQVKESQMQAANNELKNQANSLGQQLKTTTEEQSLRLKQVVKEFQAQLEDKDKELQAALENRFDRHQSYESTTIQEYKEQLKDFQVELTRKSQELHKLAKENEKLKCEVQDRENLFTDQIEILKSQHALDLQNLNNRWEESIKQTAFEFENKYENNTAPLTSEIKSDENSDEIPQDLETATKVAMPTTQSNAGSFHTVQQTLFSQKKELAELRKLVKIRHESVEDSTEIEYLRNILYKYMMGKETIVLARVISAIVKFDPEQTSKILKREEDKLTLLGSLGLT